VARLEQVLVAAAVVIIALSLVTIVRAAGRPSTYRLDYSAYPVGATQWLRDNNIEGRLLIDFNNGSFAFWRLYPRMTVSMDGRYEAVYPDETGRLNTDALSLGTPQSERAINILNPTHALVRLTTPNHEFSAEILATWNQIYRDEHYAILSRHPAPKNLVVQERVAAFDMWQPLF
jgi:hypothetical protein